MYTDNLSYGFTDIASSAPATQATQSSNFQSLINSVVQGTVGVIQTLKQPAQVYPSVTAGGGVPGSSVGAASGTYGPAGSGLQYALLGGAGVLLIGALVMLARR